MRLPCLLAQKSKQVEIRLAQDAYDGSTSLIEFEMERILKNETILAEDQISVDNNISGYVHIEENDLKLLVYVENMNDLPEFAKEKLVKEIKSEISARRTLAKENPNWPIVEILYYHITYKSDHIAGLVFEEWSRGEGSKVDPVAFAQTKIWVSDSSKLPKAIYSEDGAELYSWIDIYKTAEAEQAIAAYILPKFKTCLQKDQFYSASQRQEALSKDNVWESQGRHYFYRTSLLPSTKKNKIGGL